MPILATFARARAQLDSLCDKAVDERETIVIRRRGKDDVALIAADELRSLEETAHLLRSPANAERLIIALARSIAGEGRPEAVDELRREFGLDAEVR
jgi:antitoxin YefM